MTGLHRLHRLHQCTKRHAAQGGRGRVGAGLMAGIPRDANKTHSSRVNMIILQTSHFTYKGYRIPYLRAYSLKYASIFSTYNVDIHHKLHISQELRSYRIQTRSPTWPSGAVYAQWIEKSHFPGTILSIKSRL